MPLKSPKSLAIALTCLVALSTLSVSLAAVATPSTCATIYNGDNGWIIDMCDSDPGVTAPMAIRVDGLSHGNGALVRIYHRAQDGATTPQIAIIYASGYVRLKQNADVSPSIPFGSSFVLGPAYWSDLSTYYHNPQLNRLDIDTSWLPNAPLHLWGTGTNHNFDVSYALVLPPPRDRQTRLHVTQTYTATAAATIDPVRRTERQGFKLVQVSSMYINQGGTCDGGLTDCHDSNAARFIGSDGVRHQVPYTTITPSSFIFSPTLPLGNTWLDVLHVDDEGWQGNTPNVRIALDALPTTSTVTPQGWIATTTNPNDDNVGLWLHDDGPASQSWSAGQHGQVSYWLLAQDNPPEPWLDLGLRSGFTFLNFEDTYNCFPVLPSDRLVTGTVTSIPGYVDKALQLNYNLGNSNGNWAQIRCDFDPPLDLSAYDHLRFDWWGDPIGANSLEVGLVNPGVSQDYIFARGYHHSTQHYWPGQLIVPFKFLAPWTSGSSFDPSRVSAFFISVVKDPIDDIGGIGRLAIDNLNAYNVISRTVPLTFEAVISNPIASTAAINWLASQQTITGLLKSWAEEDGCLAYTYDQALALIAFTKAGMQTRATNLVNALADTQNPDGSWYQTHDCLTSQPVGANKWEGDIAWAVYALSQYLTIMDNSLPQATTTRNRGADWLVTRINPADGCLVIDHTEATIDAWWALQSAGPGYWNKADGLKNCLLTYYWDEEMGRFKGGRNWWQPYLDNQTWGAAFLKATGEVTKARRALSYAREVLRVPAQGGQLFGFDGQGGPWSVWNEGTAQYVAAGGIGANDLLLELLAQQRQDGAMPGSSDDYAGGGVWTTRWHGIAPTVWLYNALNGEPFHSSHTLDYSIYMPVMLKN